MSHNSSYLDFTYGGAWKKVNDEGHEIFCSADANAVGKLTLPVVEGMTTAKLYGKKGYSNGAYQCVYVKRVVRQLRPSAELIFLVTSWKFDDAGAQAQDAKTSEATLKTWDEPLYDLDEPPCASQAMLIQALCCAGASTISLVPRQREKA